MATAPVPGTGGRVVVRYQDHRLVKGTIEDFHPDKPEFHVHEDGTMSRTAVTVRVRDLKAVFFVRSYEGDAQHKIHDVPEPMPGQGRKIEVAFRDGEILRGFTLGYNPSRQGFFVIPSDPDCNNHRVFVVNAAVRKIAWIRS